MTMTSSSKLVGEDAIFQLLIPGCGGDERLMETATFFDAEMLARIRANRPALLERVAHYVKTGEDDDC
jgi:hypothetical protein